MKLEIAEISAKRQKLHELRIMLKEKFFGIDTEIDKIVNSIETWYVMPDIITHPIIVNLWSLTGNGKTDLVRTLVDFLGFNNRFCEIQLSDTASSSEKNKGNKIASIILESGCKENEAGIILLDEFQRYRAIDQLGKDVGGLPYQDIWLLLSDGKFPIDDKKSKMYNELVRDLGFEWRDVIYDSKGNVESDEAVDEEEKAEYDNYVIQDEHVRSRRHRCRRADYLYLPRTTDKSLRTVGPFGGYGENLLIDKIVSFIDFSVPIEEVSNMTYLTALEMVVNYYKSRTSTHNFVKSLIFVCGNLDEAFQVAGDVDDCDTDADVFHNYTKKVSIIEIKKALGTRFKPEQISRLGNNHVIYPSLTKDAYKKIIRRTCGNYLVNATKLSGIEFELDESVTEEIYDNAVFPTQGTRPVFSSIHMMFGAPLSSGILWALEHKFEKVSIKVHFEASCLTFIGPDQSEHCVPIQFQLRDRRNRNSDNFSALVSVHEMGHAILHSELFKDAPGEIKINVASFTGGYNRYDFRYSCAKDILDRICTVLGGIVAEEIVFGPENRSTGAKSDLVTATSLASDYVRQMAMDGTIGIINKDQQGIYIDNYLDSNARIERILADAKARATKLMNKHKDFLIQSSKDLLERRAFTQAEFMEYAKNVFDFSRTIDKSSDKIDTNTKYHSILFAQ